MLKQGFCHVILGFLYWLKGLNRIFSSLFDLDLIILKKLARGIFLFLSDLKQIVTNVVFLI